MTTVCVHGIGYIGLATAALLANGGYDVVGYDPDEELVERTRAGNPRTTEADLRTFVRDALDAGFEPQTEPVQADVHIVCVPTPLDDETKRANLEYVESSGRTVANLLREGDTVVLESTVPPGTTETFLAPILESSGLVAGADFHLAHCPETVLPGNIVHELVHNDRIVGGIDDASTDAAIALYEPLVEGTIHRAPDATTAEFAKLAQNAYRDANVAFANEVARLAHDYDISARSTIELANSHPRVNVLQPGPGVGGHCLPIDPYFLGQESDDLDLILAARRVNDSMADYLVDRLEEELGSVTDARIAVLGVAYKGNVDDARHSPGYHFADRLVTRARLAEGSAAEAATDGGLHVDVRLSDPHVDDERLVSLEDALRDADAMVVTADHDEYRHLDPDSVSSLMAGRVVVDSKSVLDPSEWAAAGFTYLGL
ncbi:nucleotide sugar dehydrogenase (plasmid) [Haloferax larsenii]|uniref:UDP-N-acetyl-D-mannosamine dehydrogenase n=1 Tax=Haloferax larsenii TaxID=302484 RepID=A0ABY5RK66_HALLR|nr:nucleotide sugar dehydrogenase [Haloferax larsenii]ELZ80470.1 nucleotide sugar dehydrogenase [Haloferax larsenii JCM 13917]UVE52420.1 nucleotide sugar dehydrogenase [Haloferax larsenii]